LAADHHLERRMGIAPVAFDQTHLMSEFAMRPPAGSILNHGTAISRNAFMAIIESQAYSVTC
jgi:hypothetical protein